MIIFFGIVGSGKGTQAEILGQKLNCPVITTGDILRQKRDDPRVKAAVESGTLVGDDVLLPILEEEFERVNAQDQECILDGTPRNVEQAKWLVEKIRQGDISFTLIIHLTLSKPAALARLQKRGRHDDNERAINERFKVYEDSVVPTLAYLRQEGFKIAEINGDQTVGAVAADIEKALNK